LKKEDNMKKTIFVLAFAIVIGLTFSITEGNAQMGSGRMGSGYGMGSGMMGGGMMGSGAGQGMSSPRDGYQNNPQNGYQSNPQNGSQYEEFQKPLGPKEARAILEDYLKSKRNPNLKLGKIKDDGYAFEAEIVTKNNSLVDRILIDKNTGGMRSAY
jgi:hypothetical protein